MNEIVKTNKQFCADALATMQDKKPFTWVLNAGDTGALHNVIKCASNGHSYISWLVAVVESRVKNGTGVQLEINDSNSDVLIRIFKSYGN